MYRIGIIGSDNSHAEAFSVLLNKPDQVSGLYAFPDFRVTAIYGHLPERTAQVAQSGLIPNICKSPDEMFGLVDAVMVVFRHGDLHAKYALPFIKSGMPVWIDKPFAISVADATAMLDEAKNSGSTITGGSTCRYVPSLLVVADKVAAAAAAGTLRSVSLCFPATLDSEYGGINFYGAHLSEMACAVMGSDPVSVTASENNGQVTALVNYSKCQAALSFIPGLTKYYAVITEASSSEMIEIDIAGSYREGFRRFAGMLQTGKMPLSPEELVAPVKLLDAIKKSYTQKTEVPV